MAGEHPTCPAHLPTTDPGLQSDLGQKLDPGIACSANGLVAAAISGRRVREDVAPHIAKVAMSERKNAEDEFRKMVRWIVGIGVLMAVGAIVYLALTGALSFHLVVDTLIGVFLSVYLGGGRFHWSFFRA